MKHVWMINQYAITPNFDGGTRHYSLSKRIVKDRFKVTIVASQSHRLSDAQAKIEPDLAKTTVDVVDFVWLKLPRYKGNTGGRVINMLWFAYKKNKHPFHPGPAATLTANDPPGNRSIAPHGPEFHSPRCKQAHFFSTVGSIPSIRYDKSLPRRCERSI